MRCGKVLFVGNDKMCRQLAYVFNYDNYEIVNGDFDYSKYPDCFIIVCNKRRVKKRKNVVHIKKLYKKLNKDYKQEFRLTRNNLKNLFRPVFYNFKIIDKLPVELLKPSEMLIKVINSKPLDIPCKNIEETCYIDSDKYLWGCCPAWVKIPFGFIDDKNNYDNSFARIIKLSSLNKSFCFCDFTKCKYGSAKEENNLIKEYKTKAYPSILTIAIDKSCNLKCTSCRKCYYKADAKEKENISRITNLIIKSGWLDKSHVILAGQGEVFFSDNYKKILTSNIKRKEITLLTNGTLFNKKNWDLIKDVYEKISVQVSIDAATSETYKKLRCGNFHMLLKNLEMLGKLRSQNKICFLQFNFVVQRDNYKEMVDFVSLAKHLNVDRIQFTKLNNWGTYTKSEYLDKCLIINEEYLDYDFYMLLKNAVFSDSIVDLSSFNYFIANSCKCYGENDE